MLTRITAIANLAGEMKDLTVAMGGVLMGAATTRDRAGYYEDAF